MVPTIPPHTGAVWQCDDCGQKWAGVARGLMTWWQKTARFKAWR